MFSLNYLGYKSTFLEGNFPYVVVASSLTPLKVQLTTLPRGMMPLAQQANTLLLGTIAE